MLIALAALTACDSDKGSDKTSDDSAHSDAPKASAQSLKAKTDGGDEVVKITLGDKVKVEFGDTVLVGKDKSGKRKYKSGDEVVAFVKPGDGKFKLKTKDGKLLWKVKLKADKVKISDNEEGDNAYAIKKKDDGFNVALGDRKLGKVKFYPDDDRIKVKDADGNAVFKASAGKASGAWGVLLLKDIPEAQRFIIMAELASRGR